MATHSPPFGATFAAFLWCGAAVTGCERNVPDRAVASTAAYHLESATAAPSAPGEPVAAPAHDNRCIVPLGDSPPHAVRAPSCPKDPTGPPSLPRGWATFPDAPGQPRVAIEIADTGPSRERGLMYRTSMPEDQGMIFSWPDDGERSFWMHDTCIPLDMLYIGRDGLIEGVLEQVPAMDETPRTVPCPALHVLEVNAGWTRAHGVAPGQHVRLDP